MNRISKLAVGSMLMLAGGAAFACCPDVGHKPANSGLGASAPATTNLSADLNWNVYEFERDGVRYLQFNDANGTPHAAIAFIGDTFWVAPVGADKVFIPGQTVIVPVGAAATVVYRSADGVEVVVYTDAAGGTSWEVRKPTL